MKQIQIAIDGPASSGKSTVAKIIANDFSYTYLDTGAMYRAVTYLVLQNGLTKEDKEEIISLLETYSVSFGRDDKGEQLVFVGDVDVTTAIRENEVTNNVSWVSAIPEVREKLVALQQEIARCGGVVMDGRDIGTVVLPQADLKIFLVASVEERAERRYKENKAKGISTDFEVLKKEIEERDYKDSHRAISPLKAAKDAVYLDTTGMTINQVVEWTEKKVKELLDK
ncbi:MAG: (d)CMP kinase [Streptococcus sp.]|nr:(d)CMP kinase [Streptococcus sp.]